jgi:gamma-glutamyltranspeptidase/glutathione hydrolase
MIGSLNYLCFRRPAAGIIVAGIVALAQVELGAGTPPVCSQTGMVISASDLASKIGAQVLSEGGNAVDAAVATAFALAVTHPTAGNIGGGGFLLCRFTNGQAVAYDFRESAPAAASPTMFTTNGVYDPGLHHNSYRSVGVPGTVAGLYLAWEQQRNLPWKRLVEPAVRLARDGFTVTDGLARSLKQGLLQETTNRAALDQFTRQGKPYAAGDTLKQPLLAATLQRIANEGPAGFYEGETARAIADEMTAHGGPMTLQDLKAYKARVVTNLVRSTYRGYDVISMPPPSSGGVCLIELLNILEGYDLAGMGWGSATNVHRMAEAMRRVYADRARYLGDPYAPFNTNMPLQRLLSKEYAAQLRSTINDEQTRPSSTNFAWRKEGEDTTHLSVVDGAGNAVSLTYTLEERYGLKVVVPGAGFLLNNELGDFNPAPGLTTTNGLIGTPANLAQPFKRPLSSMTPTIVLKNGRVFMVTGSPGGRSIIGTVLQTIVNVVDFGMNAQEAVDAGRFYHEWLPDEITYERSALSAVTIRALEGKKHRLREIRSQGVAEVIVFDVARNALEGGCDRREPGGGVAFP